MSSVSSVSSSSAAMTATTSRNSLSSEDFLKVLMAELTTQDPMEPMDQSTMLNQLSQMEALKSQSLLQTTLSSSAQASKLGAAANMIGKLVAGLNEDGTSATGVVDAVIQESGTVYLQVNGERMPFDSIQGIASAPTTTTADEGNTTYYS